MINQSVSDESVGTKPRKGSDSKTVNFETEKKVTYYD